MLCKNNGYSLIIPELKNHYGHQLLADLFTETFKDPASAPRLICLDQPLVNNQNISSLIEQLKKRREKHGELIKQGLNRSDLKSGNPKASEIIHRVNRPKILFSILFSILIEPIVSVMEEKKLAQRKMVDFLNMNHFYAPEGGRLVLSQFQKVYDRLKLNRLALAVEQKIKNVPVTQTLIHDLNLIAKHLLPPSKLWTQELVISAQERLADLEELAQMLKAKKAIELSTNMFLSDDMTHSEILNRPELSAWVRNSNNESYIKSA